MGLIAHLTVVSLHDGVYVDPEDWSSHRTRYLGAIPTGGSAMITWRLQAVNAGTFGIYVGGPSERRQSLARHDVASSRRRGAEADPRLGRDPPARGRHPGLLGLVWVGLRLRRGRSGTSGRGEH